jgi:hypothetical protein
MKLEKDKMAKTVMVMGQPNDGKPFRLLFSHGLDN